MFRKQINNLAKGVRMPEVIDMSELTQEELARVKSFINALKEFRPKTSSKSLSFNWAGGLKDVFKGKSAVDLQHESSNWR
jgi:hypothetical protein